MLVAYEDKRFFDHAGVDLLALARAATQFASNGRIVSGGSTLSMQLARLIEPRESRSFGQKLRQIFRAMQIERRLSKQEILERYLTLAPYGGNLEGVRAASLAYFGKEPKRLTVSEAALLVALPQLPERRRPDRNPAGAQAARDRVLARMVTSGLLGETEAARAALDEVSAARRALPALAAHAADTALRNRPAESSHQLTISKSVQEGLEAVALEAAQKLGPRVSVAMVLADAMTGEILGEVGSADYFDASRSGWIDMTSTLRSPGSTLKPFIYGLAIEEGLIAQETLIEDRPADFAGYRPKNFDMSYQGDVTVRQALQLSLNVPAIRLLDAVGPQRLVSRFRQAGVTPTLPNGEVPGLAIGLGGVGRIAARSRPALYGPVERRQGEGAARRLGSRCARAARQRHGAGSSRRPGRSPTSSPASGRRSALPRAASPTRPAPPTATATPGRSAMTAAMCSASGSAAPIPVRCPASPAMSPLRRSCSRVSSAPASPRCRFAARRPAPSALPMAICR